MYCLPRPVCYSVCVAGLFSRLPGFSSMPFFIENGRRNIDHVVVNPQPPALTPPVLTPYTLTPSAVVTPSAFTPPVVTPNALTPPSQLMPPVPMFPAPTPPLVIFPCLRLLHLCLLCLHLPCLFFDNFINLHHSDHQKAHLHLFCDEYKVVIMLYMCKMKNSRPDKKILFFLIFSNFQ